MSKIKKIFKKPPPVENSIEKKEEKSIEKKEEKKVGPAPHPGGHPARR